MALFAGAGGGILLNITLMPLGVEHAADTVIIPVIPEPEYNFDAVRR